MKILLLKRSPSDLERIS